MGIALLVMIMIILAFIGDWGYKANYLNEKRCRAKIAEQRFIVNGLTRNQAAFVHDAEKMQIYHVASSYHRSKLRRFERRLNTIEAAKR